MSRPSPSAIDVAWRIQATRNPVLVVRKKPTSDDRKAIELVKRELGDKLKIIHQTSPDGDVLPRLFASVSTYRGISDIQTFLDEIRQIPHLNGEHRNGFSHRRKAG